MGKILKILSLVLVSLALVFGTGIHADAKKKKKKIELTEAEKAMFDKWEVKPKKRAKAVKIMRKKPQFVGAVKCNGSCHDPYYQAWVKSPHGSTFNLLKPGERRRPRNGLNWILKKITPRHPFVCVVIQQAIAKKEGSNRQGARIKKVKIQLVK